MKRLLTFLFFLLITSVVFSQTSPDTDSSYTLEDIYNRLENGTEGSVKTFHEPASGPGIRVGKSVNEIMEKAPEKSDSAALFNQVLEGKQYWSLESNNWGGKTGTMPNIGIQNITPSTADQNISEGYHDGTGTVSGDTDLDASNIKAGVTIFDVDGTYMPDIGTQNITPSTTDQSILAGYHEGNGVVSGDADLDASNIKTGVNIFGIDGTVVEATGNAVSEQVLSGSTFSKNDSASLTGTMPNIGTQNITPSTADQIISEGYHDGTGLVSGDTDLDASNIKAGVTIFDVDGTYMPNIGTQNIIPSTTAQIILAGYHEGNGVVSGDADLDASNIKTGVSIFGVDGTVVEASGNALSNQVLSGSTFSKSDSASLTGSMPNIGTQNITPSTADQNISEGYHDGTGIVSGDTDLEASNIKTGVNIFGVDGTFTQNATATAEYIVEGKTAWVNGVEITGTLTDPLKRQPQTTEYYIDSVWSSGNSTSGGDTIVLTGVFHYPISEIRIEVGSVSVPSEDIIDMNANRISFLSPAGTGIADIYFEINLYPIPYVYESVNSSGDFSYSSGLAPWGYACPVITSVSGCTDDGNTTGSCPITGGNLIKIYGSNFGVIIDDVNITIEGISQGSVSIFDHTMIEFLLSSNFGGGENMDVTVTVNGQSVTAPYLSFSGPKLDPFGIKSIASVSGGDTLVFYGSNLAGVTEVRVGTEGTDYDDRPYIAEIVGVSNDSIILITPNGVGNMTIALQSGMQYHFAEGYLSYPEPKIVAGTIRGSYGDAGSTSFTAPGNARTKIYFEIDDINPEPSFLSVYYGLPGSSTDYSCINIIMEDDSTISCITENALGAGYVFTIKYLHVYSAEGTDIFDFPAAFPVVTSVEGCPGVIGNSTVDCSDGDKLTINGTGFTNTTKVSIGSTFCSEMQFIDSTQLSCILPEGTGRAMVVAHDLTPGDLIGSDVYVEYTAPRISSVSGCSDVDFGTIECPLTGGVEITINGSNFGSDGGVVYAGGSFVTDVTHDSNNPHKIIKFTLPSGIGMDRELYFINNAGKISNIFYFSYKD